MNEMTKIEPVAWSVSSPKGEKLFTDKKPECGFITPLYTKQQLQPRVKMTKKQYDEFIELKKDVFNFYHFWQILLVSESSLVSDITEQDLMLAWLDQYCIEILPEKKWFVREKDTKEDFYLFLSGSKLENF